MTITITTTSMEEMIVQEIMARIPRRSPAGTEGGEGRRLYDDNNNNNNNHHHTNDNAYMFVVVCLLLVMCVFAVAIYIYIYNLFIYS